MKLFKSTITGVDVRSTYITDFSSKRHRAALVTDISIQCTAVMIDGTHVEFEVRATMEERQNIVKALEDVLDRFEKDNTEPKPEAGRTLAGIRYDDG